MTLETLYIAVPLLLGLVTIWGFKIGRNEFRNLKERVDSHDGDIDKLEDLNRDTNKKVTDIWKCFALGKLTIKDDEGD